MYGKFYHIRHITIYVTSSPTDCQNWNDGIYQKKLAQYIVHLEVTLPVRSHSQAGYPPLDKVVNPVQYIWYIKDYYYAAIWHMQQIAINHYEYMHPYCEKCNLKPF